MYELLVKIDLKDNSSGHKCTLTIIYPFMHMPSKADHIAMNDSYLSVTGRCHYIDNDQPSMIILTSPVVFSNYNDLLVNLDWCKDNLNIVKLVADTEPPPHYNLYRSIVNLLNIKSSDINMNNTEFVNEFCYAAIAVIMTQIDIRSESDKYNICYPWQQLLKLLINNNLSTNIIGVIEMWNDQLVEIGNIKRSWLIDKDEAYKSYKYVRGLLSK